MKIKGDLEDIDIDSAVAYNVPLSTFWWVSFAAMAVCGAITAINQATLLGVAGWCLAMFAWWKMGNTTQRMFKWMIGASVITEELVRVRKELAKYKGNEDELK